MSKRLNPVVIIFAGVILCGLCWIGGKHGADRWHAQHETHGWLVYKGGKLDRIEPFSPIDINVNEDWRALTIPAPPECCSIISEAPAGIGKPQAPVLEETKGVPSPQVPQP